MTGGGERNRWLSLKSAHFFSKEMKVANIDGGEVSTYDAEPPRLGEILQCCSDWGVVAGGRAEVPVLK
jgi:hypothetical protein